MKPKTELRFITEGIELREAADSHATISGYAAVYDSITDIGGYFREVIRHGAFARTISEGADVRALWNHDSKSILGRRSAKTLRITEDDHGLRFELDLPETTAGRDVAVSIKRGDVSGMSFGFRVVKERWVNEKDAPELRELLDVDLIEVSPVTFPAYADTEVGMRSLQEFRAEGSAENNAQRPCSLSVERERQELRKRNYTNKD